MLTPVADEIWTISTEFKVFGLIQLNGRATVIRLANGGLWVHSPVALSSELKSQIDRLGPVQHLVAPNLFHHLYLGAWREAYPEAKIYAPKGLESKQPQLVIDHFLSTRTETTLCAWNDEIEHLPLRGMPKVREHLFYHRLSQTIIVTDLGFYFSEAQGWTQLYLRFNRVYGRLGIPKIFQMMIKDKKAFRRSLNEVATWEPKQISLCHHAILSHEQLKEWEELLKY